MRYDEAILLYGWYKALKHLLIGYGNMGKRHATILSRLGEQVWSIDTDSTKAPTRYIAEGIDVYLRRFDWKWPDSVLICTPAITHAELINKIPPQISLFCEKPLITQLKQEINPRSAPTLMACNWLWCKCIMNCSNLDLCYPSKDEYKHLDYLHFSKLDRIKVNILFTKTLVQSIADGQEIHKNGPCSMFLDQMKHWLKVVQHKEKSRQSFPEALNFNRKLLS